MIHHSKYHWWKVRFADGYEEMYGEKKLKKILVRQRRNMEGKQLDYILVSNRWLTCVLDASVRWGPSEHRNVYGRADHALVQCKFSWKIRSPKPKKRKDFTSLFETDVGLQEEGKPLSVEVFNEALETKMEELIAARGDDEADTVEWQYADMCCALQHAISTLPDVSKTTHVKRETSK